MAKGMIYLPDVFSALLAEHPPGGPMTVNEAPVAMDEYGVPGVEGLCAVESHSCEQIRTDLD